MPRGSRERRGPYLSDAIRARFAAVGELAAKWEVAIRTRLGAPADVFFASLHDALTDHIAHWGAALAFYTFLSIFPTLLGLVSLASYVVDHEWAVEEIVALLGPDAPGAHDLLANTVREAIDARGATGVISALLLLWAGGQVFRVLTFALNIVYAADEPYSYFRRMVLKFAMTLSVGVFAFVAVSSGFVLEVLAAHVPLLSGRLYYALLWAVSSGLVLAAFFLVYQFVPRGEPRPRASLVGAVVATALFLLARPIFLLYVRSFAAQNLIYGSLAILISVLLWMWIIGTVVLYGGEIASHYQKIVLEGTDGVDVERLHARRAWVREPRSARVARPSA